MASQGERTDHNRRRDKENAYREAKKDWRQPEIKSEPARSRGIDPNAFHRNSRRQRPGRDKILQVHTDVLKQKKKELFETNKNRYAAFKTVTSLRTWPLQERAFRHLTELMKEHLNLREHDACSEEDEEQKSGASIQSSDHSSSGTQYSSKASSLSSGFSSTEPKRQLLDIRASPAKSSLREQHRQQFVSERELEKPLPVDHVFGSPLWSMEPRVFSAEKSGAGKRKYVVGHFGRFLDRYWRKTDPLNRHYYELIRENTPCRLYLDLEFSTLSNPSISERDTEDMLDELFLEIRFELQERFGLGGVEREHVVDLDSSTPKKFSRHWIFHMPGGFLFPHTAAMGYFMQELISRLAQDQATGALAERRPLLHKYFLVKVSPSNVEADKMTCFIDAGVYTRNRLFRLLGSAKFGKPASAALRIATKNQFPFPQGFANESFYLPAMARAKANERRRADGEDSDDDHNSVDLDDAIKQFVDSTDWSGHAEALTQTLVVPLNASKLDFPLFPFDEELLAKVKAGGNGTVRKTLASSSSLSYGQSPYPIIDKFVLNELASRGGIQGAIRAWSVVESSEGNGEAVQVIYQMSRNRWCECVGRSHKSNNISWIVDLQLFHCVQTCHDPDCRAMGFRGTPVPLPESVRAEVEDMLFDEQLGRLDEAELLRLHRHRKNEEAACESSKCSDEALMEKTFASLSIENKSPARAVSANPNEQLTKQCATSSRLQNIDSDSSDDDIDLVALGRIKFGNASQKGPAKSGSHPIRTVTQNEHKAEDDSSLSDDVLLDAIFSNPKLFP